MRLLQTVLPVFCCGLLSIGADDSGTNSLPTIRVFSDRPQRLGTGTPADSTFISAEQIERSQAASVPELLAKEANLFFRSSTGGSSSGQIAMRGFGENSGLRVLVEVDGHPFNRPDMSGIDWNQIPIGDVQSVEVLRGGQTVLYGDHALAGVVKITTKKGGDPKLTVRAAGGSDDFEQYSALASGGAGEWYADAGMDYLREPGYRTNALSWSKTVHASAGRFVGDSGSLTFRAALSESHIQIPGPLTLEQMEEDPTQSSNLGDEYSRSTNGLFTLLWEGDHEWGKTELGAGYSFRDSYWSLSSIYARNQHQGVSLTPRIQLGPDDTHLILGSDFFYDRILHDSYDSPTNGVLESWAELDRFTLSPYAFAQKELSETFTLSGGARYERAKTQARQTAYDTIANSESFIMMPWGPEANPDYDPSDTTRIVDEENSFSANSIKEGWAGEVSLLWKPLDALSLWAGWDRVYRYPALDETVSYQGYTLDVPFNEELDPETGNNFETGIKYDDGTVRVSLTGFHLALDNEIIFDDELSLNVNMGPTRRTGAEMEAGLTFERAGISARCELVRARFADGSWQGKTVPLVPRAHGIVSGWIEPVKQLRCTVYYTYTGRQFQGSDYMNELDEVDDYGLIGARIDLMPTDKIRIFVKADNILDKTYASYAYSDSYYPGAGQSFQAGLSLEF
jgi:iron complex outermembrane receptor protein